MTHTSATQTPSPLLALTCFCLAAASSPLLAVTHTPLNIKSGATPSDPTFIVNVNEIAVFKTNDTSTIELFTLDPSDPILTPIPVATFTAINDIIASAGRAVISGDDGSSTGNELHVLDPFNLSAGVTPVDIRSGPLGSDPNFVTDVNGLTVFQGHDGSAINVELHILDPSIPAQDQLPSTSPSAPPRPPPSRSPP